MILQIPKIDIDIENNQELRALATKIIGLSYANKLSHIGSCLTALPLLSYAYKQKDAMVILSSAHAGLAQYVLLETLGLSKLTAQQLLDRDGIHSTRDPENGILVSGGSLGQAITAALGYALETPEKQIYVISSDGESFEGSWMETLNFCSNNYVPNFHVLINANGFRATDEASIEQLQNRVDGFETLNFHVIDTSLIMQTKYLSFMKGLWAHYHVMTDNEYKGLKL
jgi:transketolase